MQIWIIFHIIDFLFFIRIAIKLSVLESKMEQWHLPIYNWALAPTEVVFCSENTDSSKFLQCAFTFKEESTLKKKISSDDHMLWSAIILSKSKEFKISLDYSCVSGAAANCKKLIIQMVSGCSALLKLWLS